MKPRTIRGHVEEEKRSKPGVYDIYQSHTSFGASDMPRAFTILESDFICTTPRLCQNNMTPVALRGRGTTSTYNCFPATGLYFKSKVLASVGRGSTETTRLQHGSSMFGDTHAEGGGIYKRQAWLHGFPHPCEMREDSLAREVFRWLWFCSISFSGKDRETVAAFMTSNLTDSAFRYYSVILQNFGVV